MNNTLKSNRLHIGIFGKRNVGKSSLLNFITGQNISIVSDIKGTTTDVVEKTMELLPIGAVVFLDTAGIDDVGTLGEKRIEKTYKIIDRTDVAILVCDYNGIDEQYKNLISELKKRNINFCIVVNKNDIQNPSENVLNSIKELNVPFININTNDKDFIDKIKQILIKIIPDGFFDEEKLLNDIISTQDTVLQVMPIDSEAPKGRLILPQVRTIRNILDIGAYSLITDLNGLENALNTLNDTPKLVITDSQVFKEVAKILPENLALTSYSIIFARLKGDLKYFAQNAKGISSLKDGDKILICESCTHNATCEDIGRVKLPNLIKNFTKKNIIFEVYNGHDFPKKLDDYALILHCGGCMTNKREILSRIMLAKEADLPMTNYGIAIAYCLGILDRAIKPFEIC